MRGHTTLFLGAALVLSGCIGNSFLKNELKELPSLKSELERLEVQDRYSYEQQMLLKRYFSTIEALEFSIRTEVDDLERLDEELEKQNLEAFCRDYLLQQERYKVLRKPCVRNRFFVCAESMNQYPKLVKSLRERLNERNQSRFDAQPICKGAIE